VKLNGKVDALVFAGGIGEKSALFRRTLSEKCRSLGVEINLEANENGPEENETVKDVSKGGGKGPRVLICQTNEQVCFCRCFLLSSSLPFSMWKEGLVCFVDICLLMMLIATLVRNGVPHCLFAILRSRMSY
jgi:Acetokinase family